MTDQDIISALSTLFEEWANEAVQKIKTLPRSGSDRQYFRLHGTTHTAIGAYNPDERENRAFIGFTKHFYNKNIRVPEIYNEDLKQHIYLQQDLGDNTLFKQLQTARQENTFPDSVIPFYKKALSQLAFLQIEGGKDLNYDLCYPKATFDRQSILWDLNYFKYYFLKLTKTTFDEQALEDDFHRFADDLLATDSDYFLFRDFQSRNIMLHNDDLYFIDYQGGRRGALQYDIASLLWQAKADLPYSLREELLDFYIKTASQYIDIDNNIFIKKYYSFVLVRCLQVLGAYGFRGLYEKRAHFITSIPLALKNLTWLSEHAPLPDLPMLKSALERMLKSDVVLEFSTPKPLPEKTNLTVSIKSFSYKRGIPDDTSGNGGGFVFDCRAIHNPGRYEPYKKLTGRDLPVQQFLLEKSDIQSFLNHIFSIVDSSVEMYMSRNFTHLAVNFGCTGGQHRSVYSADMLAKHLKGKYDVNVQVEHLEQERKNWIN